jgi:hypothetical protein
MSGIRGELQNLFTKNTLVLYGHTAWFTDKLLRPNMSPELEKVLEVIIINVVNDIRTRPIKARMFASLCEEFGCRTHLFSFILWIKMAVSRECFTGVQLRDELH